MAGTGPGDLFACANEYLQACITALGQTPAGAPPIAYVSPGVPAWDCPNMLTVHVGGPSLADTLPLQPVLAPGHRIAVQGLVNMIALTATILRCAPLPDNAGNPPSPAVISGVAQQTTADLWSIWQYVKYAKRNGLLFAPDQRELFIDPAVSLIQSGGVCGWEINVRVQLDGYRIDAS